MKKTPYTDVAAFILRVGMGALMIPHGIAKIDRFNGLTDVEFADPVGVGTLVTLVLALFAELLCATLLIVGFKTRLASVPLIATMAIAAFVVHGSDAWAKKELAVVYLVGYLAVFALGSGKYSLDQMK